MSLLIFVFIVISNVEIPQLVTTIPELKNETLLWSTCDRDWE